MLVKIHCQYGRDYPVCKGKASMSTASVAYVAPTFQDVLQARLRIRPYLARTPLYSYPALNELVGTKVYVKHENYQPVGAFKVRGGVNLISQLSREERERGVIAASTGN